MISFSLEINRISKTSGLKREAFGGGRTKFWKVLVGAVTNPSSSGGGSSLRLPSFLNPCYTFVEDSRKIQWCPYPSCDSAVEFVVGSGSYDVTCICSYSFCWNVSKEQHERVKSSIKYAGNSIQPRSLNNVLGSFDALNVQPFARFEEEECKKLHEYWVKLATEDIPVGFEKLEKQTIAEARTNTVPG